MPPPRVTSVQGPFQRVIDQGRAGKPDPNALRDLADGVILPTGAIVGRPGIAQLATHPGAPGEAQGLLGAEIAGTIYTLAVVGGRLASYDWALDTWTTVAHTGTTINVTGAVALVAVFDQLVVSDGVNRPWRTTLGSGTGAYLPVSGPLYGQLVVKDAKLFGILANDRRTLVWSEEADLAIGFDTAGYNDAWDLRQTSQAALVAIRADNTSLRYQRELSSGQILGAVNDDFQASGTHDDLSPNDGTLSPFGSVLTSGGVLWSVDSKGRPYRVAPGTGVDTLWLAADNTVGTVNRDRLAYAWGLFLPDDDTVAFALPRTAGSLRNTDLLRFDRSTGDYVGRWRMPGGADWAWGALAVDDAGIERLAALDHAGHFFVCWRDAEADADIVKAFDAPATGAVVVPTRAVLADAQQEGADQAAWCQWTAAIVETGDPRGGAIPPRLEIDSTGTTIGYEIEVPDHPFSGVPRIVTIGCNGRKQIGLKRWGRWLSSAWTATAGAGSERFRLWKVTFIGSARDSAPRRR